jgi:hypothetical protein
MVKQQHLWHQTYERFLNELHCHILGACFLTNKSFGDLIYHFITGGVKTNMSTSEDIKMVRVVGLERRKKHTKKTADCRLSILIYCTYSVFIYMGPKVFYLKGKMMGSGYTNAFIHKFGCGVGTTLVMTETGSVWWLQFPPHFP